MVDVDRSFMKRQLEQLKSQRASIHEKDGSGGDPPGGGGLEKRVADLEKASQEIREKLVRVDGRLDTIEKTMATEVTLAGLRTDVAKELGAIRVSLSEEAGAINQSVANFRTEITRVEGTMIKWYIVTALALASGFGAIAFGLARALPR